MGIGQRKPVKLQRVALGQSPTGRNTQGVTDTYSTWAEVSNPSGGRDYLNGQTHLENTKRFQIRFRFDLQPNCDWRIVYENKVWTVTSLRRVDEKNFYWQLTATSKGDV